MSDATSVSIVVEQLRRRVPGGIGTYTRGLLDGLSLLGHRGPGVSLVASGHWARGVDPLRRWGFPVRTLPLPGPVTTRLWDRGVGVPRLRGLTHATSFAHPPTEGPLSVMIHDLAFREVPEAFPERGRQWHERRLQHSLRSAERFVVPTTRTADALVGAGAPSARVVVIEEGADHLPPADRAGAARLLADAGINDRFVLTVGTIEPRKNLARLFEAYARSGLADTGWSLAVVGADGWGDAPGAIPTGVRLLGAPSDEVLSGLYAEAEAFVYVPLVEGFGLPPVEAMGAGTAVIASTEVPSVGSAAHRVDPADTDAIAAALSLVPDESFRSELVARGLQHVLGMTWQRCAAAHVELWESMA